MRFLGVVTIFSGVSLAVGHHGHCDYFANRVIFTPPADSKASYPRVAQLSDGSLLSTISWRDPSVDKPYFPIFKSKDGGCSWKHVSNLTDDVNNIGLWAQPALAELPEDYGEFPKGTVLASGNSANNYSTNIDVYASHDKGHSWEFVSNVARGGRPNTTNGADPVWEPFILPYQGKIGVFYSDQRDPLHGQKLAHQKSENLKDWGPVVNDVAYLNYTVRPGMTVIDYIPTIDKWIFVHEFPPYAGGINWFANEYPCFYRLASNPFDFRFADSFPIIANDSSPNGSPYVVWTSAGGANGTVIVSDADTQEVFTNHNVGRVDQWAKREQPGRPAYSRALHIDKNDPDRLLIFSGSTFDSDPPNSTVPFSVTALSIKKLLADGYSNGDKF
jgi:hypothetical protein